MCVCVYSGSLWTPLESNDEFTQNIGNLVGQIQAAVGVEAEIYDVVEGDDEDASGELFSVDEIREELERLRADDKKPVITLTSDGDECALPFVIPEASDALVVSDSMHTLVDTVISATSKRRCGFWGTGVIGKTTTSAWLCRQRRKFTSNPPLVVIPRPFLTGCL